MVTPNGNYKYQGWAPGEAREVVEVVYLELSDVWVIKISNPLSPLGYSNYTPTNFKRAPFQYSGKQWVAQQQFKQKDTPMERVKFFAMKIGNFQEDDERLTLSSGKWPEIMTPLRDSRHQTQIDVQKQIVEGEQWVVVSTVQKMEGLAPRPPIQITEYK
jgi:hypothetical protein